MLDPFRRITIGWAGSVLGIFGSLACSVYDLEADMMRRAGQGGQAEAGSMLDASAGSGGSDPGCGAEPDTVCPDASDGATAGSAGVSGASGASGMGGGSGMGGNAGTQGGAAGAGGAGGNSGAGAMGGAGASGKGGTAGAADGGGPGGSDGASGAGGMAGAGGATDGGADAPATNDGGSTTRACAAGQFLTGFDSSGNLSCASLDALSRTTINESCFLYAGWRDGCEGCTDPPLKWGWVNGTSCQNGSGVDNTCAAADLGGANLQLFGLNLDGTADQNDKFFTTLHCAAPTGTDGQATGACPAGQFVTGLTGDSLTCTSGRSAVLTYVRSYCSIYLGWRDTCTACTTPPDRWGRANDTSCDVGVGPGNSCQPLPLGIETVNLFGMNTGGDVNGDDKFYTTFHCAGAPGDAGPTMGVCPPGQLVTGIDATGTLQCGSAGAAVERYARQQCFVYSGWRDSCNACTTAPAKWGRVNDTTCMNGTGANNTCTDATLGSESLRLFGLNTAGTVGADDKFYTGFRCE
jgi:hypothetical protein